MDFQHTCVKTALLVARSLQSPVDRVQLTVVNIKLSAAGSLEVSGAQRAMQVQRRSASFKKGRHANPCFLIDHGWIDPGLLCGALWRSTRGQDTNHEALGEKAKRAVTPRGSKAAPEQRSHGGVRGAQLESPQ